MLHQLTVINTNIEGKDLMSFLSSLLEIRPNINDAYLINVWMSSILYLAQLLKLSDPASHQQWFSLCFMRIFELLQWSPNLKSNTKEVHKNIQGTLKFLLNDLLTKELVEGALNGSGCLIKVLNLLKDGLKVQYQSGWQIVLVSMVTVLKRISQVSNENVALSIMKPILMPLTDDSIYYMNDEFPHKEALDQLIGQCIASFGLESFLTIFPLSKNDEEELNRVWLLPLLKENIKCEKLSFFMEYFLPLSKKLAQKGQHFVQLGKQKEAQMCAIVWQQIWDLVPSFCHAPIDLITNFPALLTILLNMLENDNDRGPCICEALRNIVTKNIWIAQQPEPHKAGYKLTSEQAKLNLEFLSAEISGQFLPSLFTKYINLSAAEDEKSKILKQQISATLSIWVSIVQPNVLTQFFETTLKKYLQETMSENTPDRMYALLDLVQIFLSSKKLTSISSLDILVEILFRDFDKDDSALQKRIYKCFSIIYQLSQDDSNDSTSSPIEIRTALKQKYWENETFMEMILSKVSQSMLSIGAPAKKDRLLFISNLIQAINNQNPKHMGFLHNILSEIILSTKEVGEKTRMLAFDILIQMGRKMHEADEHSQGTAIMIPFSTEEEQSEGFKASLEEFLQMVLAGLGGKTPFMISATLHCLSRILFEFRDTLKSELADGIFQTVLLFSQHSKSKEIIKASISFLKVMIAVWTPLVIQYLQTIVGVCCKWTSDHKSHFRVSCRYLLERMIRKVGYEQVAQYVPEEQHKLLTSIRKKKEKAQKKTSGEQQNTFDSIVHDEEHSDHELEEEDLPQVLQEMVQISKKKNHGQNLKLKEEQSDDDMMDFLDQKMIGRIQQNTHFSSKQKKKVELPEKDGKLLINEEENDENKEKNKNEEISLAQSQYMESIHSKDAFKYSADGKRIKFSNKRRPESFEDDPLEQQSTSNNNQNKKKRKLTNRELKQAGIEHTGREYKAKKAKGDVKRPGMPDPFAYIPLKSLKHGKRGRGGGVGLKDLE